MSDSFFSHGLSFPVDDIVAKEVYEKIEKIGKELAKKLKSKVEGFAGKDLESLLDNPEFLQVVLCFELLKAMNVPEIRETLLWLYAHETDKNVENVINQFKVVYDEDKKIFRVIVGDKQ